MNKNSVYLIFGTFMLLFYWVSTIFNWNLANGQYILVIGLMLIAIWFIESNNEVLEQ